MTMPIKSTWAVKVVMTLALSEDLGTVTYDIAIFKSSGRPGYIYAMPCRTCGRDKMKCSEMLFRCVGDNLKYINICSELENETHRDWCDTTETNVSSRFPTSPTCFRRQIALYAALSYLPNRKECAYHTLQACLCIPWYAHVELWDIREAPLGTRYSSYMDSY